MSLPENQTETSASVQDVNHLSADKRALLAKRLRQRANTVSSDQYKPEDGKQNIPVLGGNLVKRFRALVARRDEHIPEMEIIAWFGSADDEIIAQQRKAENDEISEEEWKTIKAAIFVAGKILAEQYYQSAIIQQRYKRFLVDHDFVCRLLEHPKYKFTHDLFDRNIKQWEQDFSFLKGSQNLRFLEIGSFEGRSTCWLLENILTHATSTIICIDPFNEIDQPRQEEYFDFNIEKTGAAYKVTKLRGHSQIALRFLSAEAFDLIYIDGSHVAGDILQDAMLAWSLLKRRGILVFDDYEHILPFSIFDATIVQPRQAIDAFLSLIAGRYLEIHKGWQIALSKLY